MLEEIDQHRKPLLNLGHVVVVDPVKRTAQRTECAEEHRSLFGQRIDRGGSIERKGAARAEALLRKAAARARETEREKEALSARYEKLTADADKARQDARKVAAEAEDAAQAVADAERALAEARRTKSELASGQ